MARRYGPAIFAAILAGLVLVAYRAAPDNTFHFDDYPNIVEQQSLHVAEPSPAALIDASLEGRHPQRFVANLTFALDWWRGGGSPRPFQWTNLLIHVAGALLVFALLTTVLGAGRSRGDPVVLAAAFFGAAWWALHPIQVQAVTYIVQRMASLAAVLVIAAVLCYVRGRLDAGHRWRWMSLAAVCTLLAAFTKENAWILPLLFLLAEFGVVRNQGRLIRSRLDPMLLAVPLAIGLYLAVALWSGSGAFAEWVQRAYESRAFTLEERLLTQPRVVLFHFSQLLWPLPGRFAIEHAFPLSRSLLDPASTLVAMLLMAGWIGSGLWCLLTPARRLAGFFILWVPLTLAIENSVIALEMVFEHRMYLPAVGVAGLLAMAARWAFAQGALPLRAGAGALGVVTIAALLAATSTRVPEWRSEITVLQRAYEHAPDSPRVVGNLGVAYMNAGQLEAAGPLLGRATELDPAWPKAWYNLALWHAKTGNPVAAEAAYRQTLQLSPESPPAWQGLGDVYRDSGRAREARVAYDEALRIAPQRADVLLNRGRLLSDAFGQHEAALRDLDLAQAGGADGYRLRWDRGVVLGRLGRTAEAIAAFTGAIELDPDNPAAWYDRGLTYLNAGREADAGEDFSTAASLDPGYADAHVGIASVSLLAGDYEAARDGFEHALSLDPGNVNARFNLGVALEFLGDSAGARAHFEAACADGLARACSEAGQP